MEKFFNIQMCSHCRTPWDGGTCTCQDKVLILPMGLPRSGKSTYCKELIAMGVPVVNPDSIRLALYGETYLPAAERMVWTQAHYMVKSLFIAGHMVVAVDATNTTAFSRDKWKSMDWRRHIIHFPTSEDVCLERAISNGQEYLISVIKKMARQLAVPTDTELMLDEKFYTYSIEG